MHRNISSSSPPLSSSPSRDWHDHIQRADNVVGASGNLPGMGPYLVSHTSIGQAPNRCRRRCFRCGIHRPCFSRNRRLGLWWEIR